MEGAPLDQLRMEVPDANQWTLVAQRDAVQHHLQLPQLGLNFIRSKQIKIYMNTFPKTEMSYRHRVEAFVVPRTALC